MLLNDLFAFGTLAAAPYVALPLACGWLLKRTVPSAEYCGADLELNSSTRWLLNSFTTSVGRLFAEEW